MASTPTEPPAPPRFGHRPALPTGRSVVGGLLVAAAALGTVAAAEGDGAPTPPQRAVVARDVAPGDRLGPDDLELVPVALAHHDDALFARVEDLTGALALAPLQEGDLVQRSAVLPAGEAPDGATQVSFRLESARALGGRLVPGERVDVLATFGTGVDAETRRVAGSALVVRVDAVEAVTAAGEVAVTLAVDDPATVVPLVHATSAAAVTLVRTSGRPDGGEDGPGGAPEGSADDGGADDGRADDGEADDEPGEDR